MYLLKERLNLKRVFKYTSKTALVFFPVSTQKLIFWHFFSISCTFLWSHEAPGENGAKHCIAINNHGWGVIISLLLHVGRRGGNWSRHSSGYTVTCWAGILSMEPRRSTLQLAALFTSYPSRFPSLHLSIQIEQETSGEGVFTAIFVVTPITYLAGGGC